MKGIVFTEFLDMVESNYGYSMVDQIIQASNLPSEGIYTSVGTYGHDELVQLITNLSIDTQTPIPKLLRTFGHYMFNTFKTAYPDFFSTVDNGFQFLESIDNHIHVEVKKLYPEAQLPRFKTRSINAQTLEMIYMSDRHLSDFALGLIEKTMDHYSEPATIDIEGDASIKDSVTFIIRKF